MQANQKKHTFLINNWGTRIVKPVIYSPRTSEQKPLQRDYATNEHEVPVAVKTSYLGTPVLSEIVLRTIDGIYQLELDTAVCEVQQKKRIISTSVFGRNHSVKEYINSDDYNIRIRGYLINEKPDFVPQNELEQANAIANEEDSVEIISPFLNDIYKIYNVAINSIRIIQEEGRMNIVRVEIDCDDDKNLEIIVTE